MAGSQDFATLGVKVEQQGARKTEQDLNRVSGAADRTAKSFKKTEDATDSHSKATDRQTRSTKRAEKAQEGLNGALTRSSGRLKVIGRDINRYFIVPMTAFVGLASRAAFTLNDGLGNVQALIPDTGDRIYELQDAVRDLGAETGKTFQDITDGLYRTISVFQDNSETVDRLNTAIKAGIAGYATTAEAVQLLSSVTRSYGDTSAEAVEKVADLAFETIRLGDTTMPQLSAAMQVATDRAVRLGISQEELFATMSTLTGITGDASMVATQFRSAMDSILRPTDELTDLIQRMGYETAEAAIAEESMVGLLVKIAREAERTGRPLQNYITRKEGVTLVSRLASEQLGDFAFRLGEIEDSTGAASAAFENVTEGVAKWNFEIREGRERINGFLSEIGDNLLPILARMLQGVGDIVEAFAMLPDPVQRSTIGMIAFAAALSGLLQVIGALKGLKVVALFGGIGRAVKNLGSSAAVLVKVIGVLGGLATALGVVATVLGVTFVRGQRRAAEETEEFQERVDSLNNRLKELRTSASMTERSFQALTLSREQLFESRGSVPMFDPEASGMLRVTGQMFVDRLTDEQVSTRLEQYRELRDRYKEGFLADLKRQEEELSNQVTPIIEQFNDRVINEADRRGMDYDSWVRTMFPFVEENQGEALSLFRGNINENFGEIAELVISQTEHWLSFIDENGRDSLNQIGENSLNFLRPLYNALTGGHQDPSEVITESQIYDEIQSRLESGESMMASIEGAINVLSGRADSITEDIEGITGPSWQEIFEKVTGINVEGLEGDEAAERYEQVLESYRERAREISQAMGGTVDEVDLAASEAQRRLDEIRGLYYDNMEEFSFQDLLVGGPGARGQERGEYTNMLEGFELAIGRVADASSTKFDEISTSASRMRDAVSSGQVPVESLSGALGEFEELQEGIEPIYEMLDAEGLLEKYPEIAALFQRVGYNVEDLTRLLEEAGEEGENSGNLMKNTFEDVMSSLTTLVGGMKQGLFTFFQDVAGMGEETSAIMADVFGDVGMAMLDGVTQSVHALGVALGEFGSMGDNFKDTMAEIWSSILETIPPLMIQAGLIALINQRWVLGGMLLAMGIGGTVLSGYLEGRKNKEEESDINGATQMNARGGIINTPVTFASGGERNMAGEAGWESIMPLTRNASGELGVKANGGGGTEVNVNVHNYAGSDVEVEEQNDGSGNIDIVLKKAVKGMVNSGALDKELRGRYGLRSARA